MIRRATVDDIPRIVELGLHMHAESRYAVMQYSHEKVSAMAAMVIERGIMLVADDGQGIYGFFAGIAEPHWFSDDKIATDLGIYVMPSMRGGMTGYRLINAFLNWAEEQDAVVIDIMVNTGIKTESTAKLFERLGGCNSGHIYSWRNGKCA